MLPQGLFGVLGYIALVSGILTLLTFWLGWGLARLALPPSLRKWEALLAPLLGYALLLVVAYWLVRGVGGVPVVLGLLIPAAGVANFFAWRRGGPPRLPRSLGAGMRHTPLLGLAVVSLLVGVLPLLSYGYPTVIGGGWDIENYLPVSRYLERGPISAIASAPANPLRDMNAAPPEAGLTLGFSIAQASVDSLTGGEALATFSIVMAWLRALGVVAVYVLFRSVLGLARGAALVGAAFVGAGALFLWVTYFNFGMQLAAWPLIPLALVTGISAVEAVAERGVRAGWPALLPGAVSFAALPVAYYPALTLAAPLAAGMGLALFAQSSNRLRALAAAGLLSLLALLLALPAAGDYFPWFAFRYSQKLTTLGIFQYVPLTDFAGLTSFSRPADVRPAPPLEAWVALALLGALGLLGLARGPARLRWLGLVLGAAGYMLWLRFVQEYPYAWMKGGSYAAFPFLGLAASGLGVLWEGRYRGLGRRSISRSLLYAGRAMGVGLGLGLLALMGWAQTQVVRDHWAAPHLFSKQLPALYALRQEIAPGSTVMMSRSPSIEGIDTGLLAYMIDHATFIGSARSAYTSFDYGGVPGEVGDYLLLRPNEDPALWGFSPGEERWRGGGFILYSRREEMVARKRLDLILPPGGSARLYLSGDWALAEPLPPGDGASGPRSLSLALASAAPARLLVDGAAHDIPPGVSTFTLGTVQTPRQLALKNEGQSALVIYTAMLLPEGGRAQGIEQSVSSAVARATSLIGEGGTVVTTTIAAFSPRIVPLELSLEVWDRPNGRRYGSYSLGKRDGAPSVYTITLDLASGAASARSTSGDIPLAAGFEGLRPGTYTGRLDLVAGTYPLASSGDLFRFTVERGGSVGEAALLSLAEPLAVSLAGRPPVPLNVTVGNDLALLGYALTTDAAMPGSEPHVTFWWRTLRAGMDERSVLIHLVDAQGRQVAAFDGAPASGGKPTTTWSAGETVVDDHALKLAPDLPAGDYSLLVGMYRYPSVELLPLRSGEAPLPNNVVAIPFRVVR